jgi:hypothetical protein
MMLTVLEILMTNDDDCPNDNDDDPAGGGGQRLEDDWSAVRRDPPALPLSRPRHPLLPQDCQTKEARYSYLTGRDNKFSDRRIISRVDNQQSVLFRF